MAESDLLLKVLKRELRAHGKAYTDVAALLDISVSSVKRLFSSGNISLLRLERICAFLELELADLFRLMDNAKQRIDHLTLEQETLIVSDPKLLLVTICALGHWHFEDILGYYDLSREELILKLGQLDHIKIIELLPNNRIKLLISPVFSWLPRGPIQTFFQQHVQSNFFNHTFAKQGDVFGCLSGMLTTEDKAKLQKQLDKVATLFAELNKKNAGHPIDELQGSALVFGLRSWTPELLDKMRR